MIAGLQQSLSIAVGALLLIIVCMMYLNAKQLHQNMLTAWISKRLVPLFGRVTHARGGLSALYTGLLNGLLPCGLVYIGIIGSVAAGSALKGMLFMFCFGVGTMPVMLSFLLMAKQFSFNFRYKIKKLAPIFISFVAVLLILRGLNLGIPYLSPSIHSLSTGNENAAAIECR